MNAIESKEGLRIVPLTVAEIEMVTGGKAVEPTKGYFERFTDWLSGARDFPPRIPLSEVSNIEAATLYAGGEFFRNASMLIQVLRADGSTATIELV